MTDSTSEGKLRVAIYARVSGEEQTIGRNIEAQVAELKDSIPASHRLMGIYMDDGVSGSVPLSDRPEGSRLMLDAAAGRFDQVLATRLDRVSRNNLDLRQLADSLASMGIKLAAQGMVYGPDPMGRLLLSQLGSIAEFERDLIKERTISGKRYKARTMGRWPGGTIPYGYGYEKGEPGAEGTWQVVENEADVIRRIFQMCVAENLGASAIADRLTNEGTPTPSAALSNPESPRAKPRFRVSKTWERSQVARMLRNPTYTGRHFSAVDGERDNVSASGLVQLLRDNEWQKTGLIEMSVPTIVDECLWWAAQDRLDARRKLPNRQHQDLWPLQGWVTCANDGRGFKCRRNNKNGPRVYSCAGRERRALLADSPRCDAPRLDAERLEAAAVSYLLGLLSNPTVGRTAVEDYLARLQALQDEASKGLQPILTRLKEVEEREKRLDDLYLWNRMSREEFQQQFGDLMKVRETLEDDKRQRQRELDDFDSRRHDIERIRAAIADDRFGVTFRPSAGQLRVTLFKERDDTNEWFDAMAEADALAEARAEDGATPPALESPNADRPNQWAFRLRKGIKSFTEATTEGEFETPTDLRRFFDLFDIKVVVHTDYVEVRGIFPNSIEISLDEVNEVSLLRSRSALRPPLA